MIYLLRIIIATILGILLKLKLDGVCKKINTRHFVNNADGIYRKFDSKEGEVIEATKVTSYQSADVNRPFTERSSVD